MEKRDISGYVVGSSEKWVFNVKGADGTPLDPRELYNTQAVLHVFRNDSAETPLRTLDMITEPLATGGPIIYRQLQRGDFAGYLDPNNTYWYRVEVETRTTDQDIVVAYGDLATAKQPVMRDDIPN